MKKYPTCQFMVTFTPRLSSSEITSALAGVRKTVGKKVATCNGQSLIKAFVPLPGGAKAIYNSGSAARFFGRGICEPGA